MVLRRSSRLSQNVEQNKSMNYALVENLSEEDSVDEKRGKKQKKSMGHGSNEVISTDEKDSTNDSDYTGKDITTDGSNEEDSDNGDNSNIERNADYGKKSTGVKEKKGTRGKNNKEKKKDKTIVPYRSTDKNFSNSSDDNVNKLNQKSKRNNIKNSYMDRLNKDLDDDDFDIFKRSSKFDRNKRITTGAGDRNNNDTEFNLKKRKSVYVESSDSDKSSESDDEYTNENSRPAKKQKKNNKMNSFVSTNVRNVNKNIHKNFADFNLYDKIKKNPKNLHEIIEEIYYNLFNREDRNEKVKISTFFLNFLAECSGNETLTWTVDIIDYIDKQIYLYEDICDEKGNNNKNGDGNSRREKRTFELITPSTAKSCNRIVNIDEIIKDENSFEKVCTFKCEKLEQYLTTDMDNDVLIKSRNENNKSYKAFSTFFTDFSFHFDENYTDEILYICIWIFSLSVSKYRKIRFTSSLASLSILLGLCKKINYINNHEKQSRRQLLAEYARERAKSKSMKNGKGDGRRGSNTPRGASKQRSFRESMNDVDIEELIQCNKRRNDEEMCAIIDRNLIISQLINNINEDRKNLTTLNNFLLCTYNILYRNKIKDVFIDIRVIALEYYYYCLEALTIYFTNRKFTKLLIWILHDKDSKVKIASLNILIYLCNLYNNNHNTNKNFKIVELLYMCKKKLLNLIFDNDHDVRIKTFELILQMSKMKIKKSDLQNFKKQTKRRNSMNIKDNHESNSSSEYEESNELNSNTSAVEPYEIANSLVPYGNNKEEQTSSTICILSKKEKKIISNLIWFNNNSKISHIITSLIYESQIKNRIKETDKKRNTYFDVEQNEANNEIARYNILYLAKYLNKNIPTVKNFVHYFDYLANYNENMKLFTVIDKFVSGIRDKLDSLSCIDVIIELLCEDGTVEASARGGVERGESGESGESAERNNEKGKNKTGNAEKNGQEKRTTGGGEDISTEHTNEGSDEDARNERSGKRGTQYHARRAGGTEKDLRKCLLHICESAYRNFQSDINELERNKNRKVPQFGGGKSGSNMGGNSGSNMGGNSGSNMGGNSGSNMGGNSGSLGDKSTQNSARLSNDTNKIKKMIIYTFHIIKNSKLLIKLHQTNQEHLLLIYKIIKIALYECKRIYKNEDKNNVYNFTSTIMEYFKNDIDSNINFFFNNVYIYLKETYDYLFYMLKNFKLPFYSSKYTINMISFFLSLNEELKGNNKLPTDSFFDLYYFYFNNFLDAFLHYRKNYNAEITCDEDEGYIKNKKKKAFIISENLAHKDKNIIDSVESDLVVNITHLIHIYTLCFNYINNDLSVYVEKKNDSINRINKGIKKLIEVDYFKFLVSDKCQSISRDCLLLADSFVQGTEVGSTMGEYYAAFPHYDQPFLTNESEVDELEVDKTEGEEEEEKSDTLSDKRRDGLPRNISGQYEKKGKGKKNNNLRDISGIILCTQKGGSKTMANKYENPQCRHSVRDLIYNPDACMHANILIQLCLYVMRTRINSVCYYEEEDALPDTPTSRLMLLCIDLVYIIYENYIYHLCKKRHFFNHLFDLLVGSSRGSSETTVGGKPVGEEGKTGNAADASAVDANATSATAANATAANATATSATAANANAAGVSLLNLKNLHALNEKRKNTIRGAFTELNYVYENVLTLRDDFNEVLLFLIKISKNTILRYGIFLNLMNIAQLENVLLFSKDDLQRYKTLEVFLNSTDKGDNIVSWLNESINSNENINNMIKKYTDFNDEIRKYKDVIRYVYKEDNILFNFVTELFKNVENINNDNYNFVNTFLSIDISIFFPINTYTYIIDMCKIYNKDKLSNNVKILEMQYMHMTLIIAQFILNCNNINIFNSCLGVLLLIHLNVKNKGLSSIALNFHNKLKKYNIDIFYEVLLCALIGLYTAYINNALEEKDLLLFSTSIASRLGVKIVDKQKVPLCKFIHSCVNCALNLKNENSFIKYILPYAQKLNLSDYQFSYLKKQILNIIESYNASNSTNIQFENSIFEHMLLVICKKKKLNEEFKDYNYVNSYMNLNESIHINISKHIPNSAEKQSKNNVFKTSKSSQELILNMELRKDSRKKTGTENLPDVSENGHSQSGSPRQEDNTVGDTHMEGEKHIARVKIEIAKGNKENDQEKKNGSQDKPNKEENLMDGERIDEQEEASDYEKTPSNSTLSNFISLNEDDRSVNLAEMENDDNDAEQSVQNGRHGRFEKHGKHERRDRRDQSNEQHSLYEIESSPKPRRTRKQTRLRTIAKRERHTNENSDASADISFDMSPKNSIEHSLNSSLHDISDRDNDNDDMSLISEKKMNFSYFEDNDDDSNSDIIPGMSPIKMRKKERSELSTPISYADDLMNF
ncbi:conserved Plasmodium protein, unknown function [Plasmodium ovale]|uniref:SCD domain-containing protein n=1 Tax=Plasmodium ovale TaxID=36330 RepID=A0A1C3KVY7_PLAOA|nr:conserved Plasmodium protein, unknown function [Plasmodium ovale]